MKTVSITCALAVPLLALNLQAQTTVAWKGNKNLTTPYWRVADNWSLGRVPSAISTNATGDKAAFNDNAQPACFIDSLAFPSQFVMGDGQPSTVYIVHGGNLTSSNYANPPANSWNAIGYNQFARLEIRPGGSLISSNHLWIGYNANGRGNLVLNGGSATVLGMIGLGGGGFGGTGGGGIGIVQVNGGTLNLAQWNDTASISPLSQLDIRGGSVFITNQVTIASTNTDGTLNYATNDHTASIANYIAGGQITGYGGVGTVHYTYNPNAQATVLTASTTTGASGPYAVTNDWSLTAWPTNTNPNLMVHYWAVDSDSLTPPNPNWTPSLGLVTGGDQATTDVTFRGLAGKQATSTYFNIYDQQWQAWNTNGLVDVLMCVYGDASILRSTTDSTQCRRLRFQLGTAPTDSATTVYGGIIPTNAYNSKWNWMLFTVTNNFQSNLVDRLMGSLRTNATGSTTYGGINGGTMRIYGLDNNATGLSIRAIAFGQHGAFGSAPDINQFAPPDGSCPPVLNVNFVGIDFNAGYTNHLQVINDASTSQDVTFANNVGPVGDQRKAVIPKSWYLNFGILSNYLGQPCNDNVAMKVCVDYYDDPAFAGMGVTFGPMAYATDSMQNIAYLPSDSMVTLQGTGRWIRQSWLIPNVNLMGVFTAPLTGGPQFGSYNGQVAVSRFYIAALRATGPLAGQDPLADCYSDPNICTGIYGNYAELDLASGVTNGVDVGNSGGDQTAVVEMAGPVNDQRLSVRPDTAPSYYLNFQILTNALGPETQGNVHLATTVTYYDDPALAGQGFWPQVWNVQQFSSTVFNYMSSNQKIILQGTGKWRDAYWEIGNIFLKGVGQRYAGARFQCNAPIHISRIRYTVIRPCGATAGQNMLSNPVMLAVSPDTNSLVRVSWPYQAPQAILHGAPIPGGAWSPLSLAPAIEGGDKCVLRLDSATANSQFLRLKLLPQ